MPPPPLPDLLGGWPAWESSPEYHTVQEHAERYAAALRRDRDASRAYTDANTMAACLADDDAPERRRLLAAMAASDEAHRERCEAHDALVIACAMMALLDGRLRERLAAQIERRNAYARSPVWRRLRAEIEADLAAEAAADRDATVTPAP